MIKSAGWAEMHSTTQGNARQMDNVINILLKNEMITYSKECINRHCKTEY